jgi:quinol monooxygenase YgiN
MDYRYKDKAAIQAHSTSEHFKKMEKAMKDGDLLAGPSKIMVTKEAGGYASKL